MNSGTKRERHQRPIRRTTAERERILGELVDKTWSWSQLEALMESEEGCLGLAPEVELTPK